MSLNISKIENKLLSKNLSKLDFNLNLVYTYIHVCTHTHTLKCSYQIIKSIEEEKECKRTTKQPENKMALSIYL